MVIVEEAKGLLGCLGNVDHGVVAGRYDREIVGFGADVVVVAPVLVADRPVGTGLRAVEVVDAETASLDEGAVAFGRDGDAVDGLLLAGVAIGALGGFVDAAEAVVCGKCQAGHGACKRYGQECGHDAKDAACESFRKHVRRSLSLFEMVMTRLLTGHRPRIC